MSSLTQISRERVWQIQAKGYA
ncbi:MAG: hypothetical protein ACRC2J_09035 [Microcoleaceae cyanobacterium]